MSNSKQKLSSVNTENNRQKVDKDQFPDNPGLDADQSSENGGAGTSFNNDNDRISHNSDGEDDDHNTSERPGNSPLMDK